jgi:hypothetical protein
LHLFLDYPKLLATKAAERTKDSRMNRLFERFRLARRGNEGWGTTGLSNSSEILFFKKQWPLEAHFHLGPAFNVDVGAAGEKRYQAHGSQPSANAGNPSGNRMPPCEAADRANCASSQDGNFRGLGSIAPLIPVLLYGAFAIVPH